MLENNFYHIYNRGNNKEKIFKEDMNYYYFLNKFNFYLKSILEVYAYCLMPNHFHFLVKIKSLDNLLTPEVISKSFKDFFISYSKSINKKYKRTGSLFQSRFKRKLISDHNHLLAMIPYIHTNPVRAKLIKSVEDWHYSSYQSYLYNKIDSEISNFVYSLYGSKENFIKFHSEFIDFQKERDFLFKKLPKSAF